MKNTVVLFEIAQEEIKSLASFEAILSLRFSSINLLNLKAFSKSMLCLSSKSISLNIKESFFF
jgi:hypothetical protein